jgi:hypothetical protein
MWLNTSNQIVKSQLLCGVFVLQKENGDKHKIFTAVEYTYNFMTIHFNPKRNTIGIPN